MPADQDPSRPPWLDKLDPRGRRRLAKDELAGRLEVLVRADGPLGPGEREALREAGFEIAVVLGDVLTGAVETADLGTVAELPFVRRIELSRTLYRESGAAGTTHQE